MDFTVHKDLLFSESDQKMTLDLFIPTNATKPVPCIMVIQGGGFKAQNGQRFRAYAEDLANNGFAAALISYRGRPKHVYTETMADVKASVRYVRKHSKEYGINADKIGAMGRSAGGTIAVLLALSGGVEDLEGDGGQAEFSSSIQAVVGIAGVYDFPARFTDEKQMAIQPRLEEKEKTNGEWIGPAFSATNKDWLAASPVTHLDPKDPPILFLHSKDDGTVPWMQSQDMYDAMIKVGIKSEIYLSDKGGHGGPSSAKKLMSDFFRKTLLP